MKKVFFFIGLLGVLLLAGTLFLAIKQSNFISSAEQTTGTVIDNYASYSKDSDGKSTRSFYPILMFVEKNGNNITFKSSVGSSSPRYQIGEKVAILYDPKQPSDAEIDDLLSIWLAPMIVGIFGVILSSIGGIFFLLQLRKNRLKQDMLKNGRCIEATIESIELNHSIKVNRRSPYVIYCQWVDKLAPDTVHVFRSENLWFNPSPYINKETISVFIDERNPHRYYVDIRFLPKIK